MKRYAVCATVLGLVSACTVQVSDETSSPFVYDPPVNAQTFRVEVLSNATVEEVEFNSPNAGIAPMAPVGNDSYEVTTPVQACAGVVEFSVDVTTQALFRDDTQRFPQAGGFTHQVTNLPDACDDFVDNFAQTFIVNRFDDFPDFNPGDGSCLGNFGPPEGTAFAGPTTGLGCSLRAAVMEANANPGNDLIRLSAGRYHLTLTGSESATGVNQSIRDLDITESVTIEGTAGVLADLDSILIRTNDPATDLTDNGNDFGYARIDGNDQQRIFHVTAPEVVLRLRRLAILHGNEEGGGGGVLNQGTLILERVVFAENRGASTTGSAFGGGAVENQGLMIAEEVAFAQNIVGGENPAGGALHNTGEAVLRRVLVAYNDARFGAAIINGGTITAENITLFNNRWTGFGSTPPVSVFSTSNEGETRLSFATFASHSLADRDLLTSSSGSTVHVKNSLWVSNVGDLCVGTILSDGGNVVEGECNFDASSSPLADDHIDVGFVAGDSSLTNEGGFLPVVEISAPFSGSSAFDARDLGTVPPFPFHDQRGSGFERRIDGNGDGSAIADPGAYEYEP